MPLLVRKLSVFRKGLVRERNLRTQAESTVDRLKETNERLKEKLMALTTQNEEYQEQKAMWEKKVATKTKQRTNEKRLDSIFASFGTKNVFERENNLLKEKTISLRKQRNNAGRRIEELEKQVKEMHSAGLTHSELFASVDREMMARDQALVQLKAEIKRLSFDLRTCNEEQQHEQHKWKEEKFMLEERIARMEQNREEGMEKKEEGQRNATGEQKSHENTTVPTRREGAMDHNRGQNGNGTTIAGTTGTTGTTGVRGSSTTTDLDKDKNTLALRTCIDQQLQKITTLKQRADQLERFWLEASQYDAFTVKFHLYKLRKVMPRREATIAIRRPIHQRDRNGHEESNGIAVVVERGGETFVHPVGTIVEVSLLGVEKGTRGAAEKGLRAFKLKYNDGSKTDWFEGRQHDEIMEMIISCIEGAS